jgi:hypothetical protein
VILTHGVTSWIFLRKCLIRFRYIESKNLKDIVWTWNFQRNILWTTWHLLLTILFHYLFYELFKDPISLRDKRIKVKSNINCLFISLSSCLHDLIIFIFPFSFYCPHDLMSWSYSYFLFHFIVLMASWVNRIYISFFISLSSWLHELIVFIFPFIFHCPSDFMSWSYLYFLLHFIVLMTFMSWSYLLLLSLWYILIIQVHIWWYWSYSLVIKLLTKVLRLL